MKRCIELIHHCEAIYKTRVRQIMRQSVRQSVKQFVEFYITVRQSIELVCGQSVEFESYAVRQSIESVFYAVRQSIEFVLYKVRQPIEFVFYTVGQSIECVFLGAICRIRILQNSYAAERGIL